MENCPKCKEMPVPVIPQIAPSGKLDEGTKGRLILSFMDENIGFDRIFNCKWEVLFPEDIEDRVEKEVRGQVRLVKTEAVEERLGGISITISRPPKDLTGICVLTIQGIDRDERCRRCTMVRKTLRNMAKENDWFFSEFGLCPADKRASLSSGLRCKDAGSVA